MSQNEDHYWFKRDSIPQFFYISGVMAINFNITTIIIMTILTEANQRDTYDF